VLPGKEKHRKEGKEKIRKVRLAAAGIPLFKKIGASWGDRTNCGGRRGRVKGTCRGKN